jgi:hypothetical protein
MLTRRVSIKLWNSKDMRDEVGMMMVMAEDQNGILGTSKKK